MSGRKRGRVEVEEDSKRKRDKPNVARAAVAIAEDPESLEFEDDHEDEIDPEDQKLLELAEQVEKMRTSDGPVPVDEEQDEPEGELAPVVLKDDDDDGEEDEEEEEGAGAAAMDEEEDEEEGEETEKAHGDFALAAEEEEEEPVAPAPNERPAEAAAGAGAEAEQKELTPEELKALKKKKKNKEKKKKKRQKQKQAKLEEKKKKQPEPFLPHKHKLGEGEFLDYDSSAYMTFHQLSVTWPCLSFDFIRDPLGAMRLKFPLTLFIATGTQAAENKQNKVQIWKVSDIHKTIHDEESDPDDSDSDLDDDPTIEEKIWLHDGVVNRIRCSPHRPGLLATQSSNGFVYIWNAVPQFESLLKPPAGRIPKMAPIGKKNQGIEGYALEWSPAKEGRLFSGNCRGEIFLFDPTESGFKITKVASKHADSVEDIQASAQNEWEFVSCSCDGTVRLWDLRTPEKAVNSIKASRTHVNVISWNRLVPNHIASGDDEGAFKVWDIRATSKSPLAHFAFHQKAITSIEWRPHDKDELAVTSEDHTTTIWDLGVEPDSTEDSKEVDVPPQLLFQHMGQQNVKEVHWHPQIPGLLVTTAENGFHIWRPADLVVPEGPREGKKS